MNSYFEQKNKSIKNEGYNKLVKSWRFVNFYIFDSLTTGLKNGEFKKYNTVRVG